MKRTIYSLTLIVVLLVSAGCTTDSKIEKTDSEPEKTPAPLEKTDSKSEKPGETIAPETVFAAATGGDVRAVNDLIESGADFTIVDGEGRTTLIYAAAFNPNPNVINAILAAGVEATARDIHGGTAYSCMPPPMEILT
jgi:hypothetical protein